MSDTVSGEDDEGGDDASVSDMTSQLTSSYLGIGKAQRKIASELKVDPYSDNPVLQAELARVAQVSGTVGKVTNILIPIPSVVGTASSVSNMVWNLSPTDLLIQNQETSEGAGLQRGTDPAVLFEQGLFTDRTDRVCCRSQVTGWRRRAGKYCLRMR